MARVAQARERAASLAGLQSAHGILQRRVNAELRMKRTPTIEFVLDAVPENARHIDDLLEQAHAVDIRVAQQAAGASYAGDADPYKHENDDEPAG